MISVYKYLRFAKSKNLSALFNSLTLNGGPMTVGGVARQIRKIEKLINFDDNTVVIGDNDIACFTFIGIDSENCYQINSDTNETYLSTFRKALELLRASNPNDLLWVCDDENNWYHVCSIEAKVVTDNDDAYTYLVLC